MAVAAVVAASERYPSPLSPAAGRRDEDNIGEFSLATTAFSKASRPEADRHGPPLRKLWWHIMSMAEGTRAANKQALKVKAMQNGLRRKQLLERVEMEMKLSMGVKRLALWLATFCVLIMFVKLPKDPSAQLGVQELIEDNMNIHPQELESVTDIGKVWELLQGIDKKASVFNPTSSIYMPDNEYLRMVSGRTQFQRPVLYPSTDPLLSSKFSIVAWVKVLDAGTRGTLIRKFTAQNVDRSCWSYNYPGEFRYGAHDVGLREWANDEEVVVTTRWLSSSESWHLEGVTVDGLTMTFFRDDSVVETITLRREVTDCGGILAVGDTGMEISGLRIFPRALNAGQLAEIAYGGSPLADIASGSTPTEPAIVTNVQSIIDQSLTSTELELAARYDDQLLADLKRSEELKNEIASRLGGATVEAAAPLLASSASFDCFVASPCRIQLTNADRAATTNFLGVTPFGTAASDQRTVSAGSGVLLLPHINGVIATCDGSFADLQMLASSAQLSSLAGLHAAAGPCNSGLACTADLRAHGLSSAAWWLMDVGVPSSSLDATVCFYEEQNQAAALQQLGILHIHEFPGFVQVAPDTHLWRGADWPLFPHPVFHTRDYDNNDRFSLSFWTRLRYDNGTLEGPGKEVGIGLLRMYDGLDQGGKWCWNVKMYYNRFQHYGGFHQPTGNKAIHCYVPDLYTLSTPVLRHTAWVFDDRDDNGDVLETGGTLKVYLDGARVCTLDIFYKPSELECPGQAKDYFMSYLSDDWYEEQPEGPAPTSGKFETGQDVQDSRFFPGKALTDSEVAALADSSLRECLPKDDVVDSRYIDAAGNGCQWYYDMIHNGYSDVCDEAAKLGCPLVCTTYQFCFPGAAEDLATHDDSGTYAAVLEPAHTHIWERVVSIKPHAICLSDHQSKEDILALCREGRWEAVGPYNWYFSVASDVPNPLKDATFNWSNCSKLDEMFDDSCSFSGNTMQQLTAEASVSQEYTVAFWAKGAFYWQLLSSVYPPGSMTTFSSAVDGGRMKVMQAPDLWTGENTCPGANDLLTNIFNNGQEVDEDTWQFYAFSIFNDSEVGSRARGFFGGAGSHGGWELGRLCMTDIAAIMFLSEGESLVSPIRMWSSALPLADITRIFYDESSLYVSSKTTGPRRSDAERQSAREIQPQPFRLPTFLIAPPLVSQRRQSEAKQCTGMSNAVLLNMVDRAAAQCSDETRCTTLGENGAAAWLAACRTENPPSRFFGRDSIVLAGEESFAEFTASLSADVVLRDGEVRLMRSLLDQFTHNADVLMLFLSPQLTGDSHKDIVSILKLRFEFDVPVVSTVSVKHVELLPDANVPYLALAGIACMVLVIVAFMDAVSRLVDLFRYQGRLGDSVVSAGFDLFITVLNAPLLILRSVMVATANDDIDDAVRQVSSIQWGDPAESFSSKVATFFDGTDKLLSLAEWHDLTDSFTLIVLVLILVRLLVSFSAHPRIALITSTVNHGADNIYHFLVVAGVVSVAFATVAWWFFGARHENFRTIKLALGVEYNLLISGELPDGYEDDLWLETFGYLFVVVVFFLLLNILLAIIVEAYLAVKSVVEATDTEQAFFADIMYVVLHSFMAKRHKWPSRVAIRDWLQTQADLTTSEAVLEMEAVNDAGFSIIGWRWYVEMYATLVGLGEKATKDAGDGEAMNTDLVTVPDREPPQPSVEPPPQNVFLSKLHGGEEAEEDESVPVLDAHPLGMPSDETTS